MKYILCPFIALLITTAAYAQSSDNTSWKPEFSAKAFISIFHGSYELTAGARIGDNVFGLGSGYGREFWDAYPAHVRKLPFYAFYRRYVPLGTKRRFLMFGEVTLGGEYAYKITGSFMPGKEDMANPFWNCRATVTPGVALRLFGNTNIYLAPTAEIVGRSKITDLMPGATLGVNVGF